jgi:hypothetical protein
MLSFYDWRIEYSAAGRLLSKVEEMLSFYERRAEDSAAGRKNAEPSVRNAAF